VPRAIHRRAPPFLDVVTTLSTPLTQPGETGKPAWEGIVGGPQGLSPYSTSLNCKVSAACINRYQLSFAKCASLHPKQCAKEG